MEQIPANSNINLSKDTSQLISYLHLALKAGKLKLGMSAGCSSCIKHKAELVICAEDMSNNSKQKISRISEQHHVRFVLYGNKQLYSDVFRRNVTGIICIEDKNFAAGLLKVLAKKRLEAS